MSRTFVQIQGAGSFNPVNKPRTADHGGLKRVHLRGLDEIRRGQVRAKSHFDGRGSSSYLLDPSVNFVPEMPLGDVDPLGRHTLRFTGEHAG